MHTSAQPSAELLANAVRILAADAVQNANSGHPGAPMGLADIAQVLWRKHLRHSPSHPAWPNRDRFVLSNGHASMLLYAVLHLSGYELGLEDLKRFRQLHSKTPGHPEMGVTPGVETTTGPLGQGFANAVGMALAERLLAGEFNRPGFAVVDHYTYVIVGDGCLMEGISHEAASLAGTLRLGRLIAIYDDNGISIDGEVQNWFADDTAKRFEAYGWQVLRNVDGHDPAAIDAALAQARVQPTHDHRPTLLMCRTVIGKGSPGKAGSADVHGSPLGKDELARTREALGWQEPPFSVPAEVAQAWNMRDAGARLEQQWQQLMRDYSERYPELAHEFERRQRGELPVGWAEFAQELLQQAQLKPNAVASRKASQLALEQIAPKLPELLGGSADLTGSNLTDWSQCRTIVPPKHDERRLAMRGNYLHYGVREFAMAALMNGVALHRGFIPFGGTFLIFSDYCRNAIRLSALMRQRVIYVLTHDSIGLGEDGPTHQPVEQLSSLRLIPGLHVWRPCDVAETMAAWLAALEYQGPSVLALSRQNLPHQQRHPDQLALIRRGGYVLSPAATKPRAVLLATGSEVALAMHAQVELARMQMHVQVVSMPCAERFDEQSRTYRDTVLPPGLPRIAIEAGVSDFWRKYVGLDEHGGRVLGLDSFGESAPAATLFQHFGFTLERVVRAVREVVTIH